MFVLQACVSRGRTPIGVLNIWRESFSILNKEKRADLMKHEYFYRMPTARGVNTEFDYLEIGNCELSGWRQAAVHSVAGKEHRIHHTHIHHNQRKGLGYGISHGKAFSLIEYNLFEWNRHSIAGSGSTPSGYIARHNLELGESLSHNFDMHGGRDRKDGTNIVGSRIEIYNNTFLDRGRAIGIRGGPDEYVRICGNWFMKHQAPCFALIIRWPPASSVELGDNLYGTNTLTVQ